MIKSGLYEVIEDFSYIDDSDNETFVFCESLVIITELNSNPYLCEGFMWFDPSDIRSKTEYLGVTIIYDDNIMHNVPIDSLKFYDQYNKYSLLLGKL